MIIIIFLIYFNLISCHKVIETTTRESLHQPEKGIYLPDSLHHTFPKYDNNGRDIANEFKILNVKNIKVLDSDSTDSTHEITNVSPLIITNDQIVNVTYYSTVPSYTDWIGAYSPIISADELTTTVPVKYGYCSDDPNYLLNGVGTLSFNLTNLRSDIGFYYFSNGVNDPLLVNISTANVTFENINEPLRPRVVATGDVNILNLIWSSANSQIPLLKWGTVSGIYENIAVANTTTITESEMCGSPANSTGWREIGMLHTASFLGTAALANSKIYYIFGDDLTNDFSSEFILNVPPLPGTQPPDRPTTIVLFDDLGRGSTDMTYTWNEYGRPSIYTAMAVGAEVAAGNVDAIYHGGDISYATGDIAVWDFFLDMISPMASGTVYLTTVGNHESDWPNTASFYTGTDSGGECGVMSTKLLTMPYPAITNEPWWSYDIGLFHIIGMSTEHNFTYRSPQYLWLENDLQSVNRTITPWIVFGGHRPMYINSNYGGSPSSDIAVMNLLIESIEPLLWKYRVNIGVYGHNHAVQRQSAVLNKTVIQAAVEKVDSEGQSVYVHDNPQATVHLIVGTGGAKFTINGLNPPPDWNELTFYQYGYAKATAVNESYLDWKWYNSITGELIDHMVIIQDNPNTPWVLPTTTNTNNSNNNGLSTGAVVAISVVSTVVGLGIILGIIYYAFYSKSSLLSSHSNTEKFIVQDTTSPISINNV